MSGLMDGMRHERVPGVDGAEVDLVVGGEGPAVLLLHGFPQTKVMWHPVLPGLREQHTVVALDLRGYGASTAPDRPEPADHSTYSFRAMAADAVAAMGALGHERFAVVGHDRGARVAHRLVRDHADRVERWAALDIAPTAHVYGHTDRALATAYWHWFFLIQPDLPEILIDAQPRAFLHTALASFGGDLSAYHPEALAEYERCFADPRVVHAACEDYRAGASVDLEHDAADPGPVTAPLLLLWGSRSVVGRLYDPVEVWSAYAEDVRGQAVDAGHFLVEERPAEVLAALRGFLA